MPFRVPGSSATRRRSGRLIAPAVSALLLITATSAAQTAHAPAPAPGASSPSLVVLQDGARRNAPSTPAPALPAELRADTNPTTPQPIPLPASALATGGGLAGLWVFQRLRRRAHRAHA